MPFGIENEEQPNLKAQMDALMRRMDAIEAQRSTQSGLSCNECQDSHIS